MNSSSAVNNVLSASPVANNAPSQRGANDDSKPGFKKALADMRSEHEVKAKEPCAKKLAADKPVKAKAAPDDAAQAGASVEKTSSSSSKTTDKNKITGEQEETALVADEITKVESPEPILAIDTPAVNPLAIQSAIAPSVTGSADLIIGGAVQNMDGPVSAAEIAPAVVGEAEILLSEGVAQQATPEMVAELDPVVAEAVDSEIEIKATDPALMAAQTPAAASIVSETLTAAVLAPAKSIEVKLDKLAVATDTAETPVVDNTLLANDDQLATTDPKAAFEKMLQAIASNTGGDPQKSPDLATAIATLASAGDSAVSESGIESLFRSAEAQSPAARNFVVQTAVPVNVGQPQWSQAVGEKVLWLAAQNVQSAEIILDPPEVGPMQVKVSVHQEQTTISFTSHNAAVRELLEQSLGRLRDMFNEQGMNLVNVDVSDRSFQRHQGDGSEQQGQAPRGDQEEEESLQAVSAIVPQRLVDHYA